VLTVHNGDAGVGRSQINTNNFSHISLHSANRPNLYRAFPRRLLSVSQCLLQGCGTGTKNWSAEPVIKASCEAYIRKAVFHCKSQGAISYRTNEEFCPVMLTGRFKHP